MLHKINNSAHRIYAIPRVFHPLGIALCQDEKSEGFQFIFESFKIGLSRLNHPPIDLLADESDAITNGFEKTFWSTKI